MFILFTEHLLYSRWFWHPEGARQPALWRTQGSKLRDGRVPGMSVVKELRSQWLQHQDEEKEGRGRWVASSCQSQVFLDWSSREASWPTQV